MAVTRADDNKKKSLKQSSQSDDVSSSAETQNNDDLLFFDVENAGYLNDLKSEPNMDYGMSVSVIL